MACILLHSTEEHVLVDPQLRQAICLQASLTFDLCVNPLGSVLRWIRLFYFLLWAYCGVVMVSWSSLDLVELYYCFSSKSCAPTLGFRSVIHQILPMERHGSILRDSPLCGLLVPCSFSALIWHLASLISTQVLHVLLNQHTQHVMIPIKEQPDTAWHWPANTHSHPQHNTHSSRWGNMRGSPMRHDSTLKASSCYSLSHKRCFLVLKE